MIWTTGAKFPWEPTSTPLTTDVRLQVWPWSFLVFQLYGRPMANIEEAKLTYLLDRLAISDVQLRYAMGADTRDWVLYRSCFTDEIDTDFTSVFGGQPRRGNADRFVEAARRFLTGLKATQHMITNHVITIEGDEATSLHTCRHAIICRTKRATPIRLCSVIIRIASCGPRTAGKLVRAS
jgi:hypothetical protein